LTLELVKKESNHKRVQNHTAIENRQQQPLVYKLEKNSVENFCLYSDTRYFSNQRLC